MASTGQPGVSQPLLLHGGDTSSAEWLNAAAAMAESPYCRASTSSESYAARSPHEDTGVGRARRQSFNTDKPVDGERIIYKYRFVVLTLFCLVSGINGFQYMVPSTITAEVVKYYGVSDLMVNTTAMLFYILYFPLAGPSMWFLDHKGTRRCVVLASALNFLGGLARVFAWSPTSTSFLWMLAGSVLLSCSAPLFFSLPPRLSALWFPPKERASATAVMVLSNQFGLALGFLVGPVVVPPGPDVGSALLWLHIALAVITLVVFVACALFMKRRPPTAPSAAMARRKKALLWDQCKAVFANPSAWAIIATYGFSGGAWWSVAVVLNQLLDQLGLSHTGMVVTGSLLQFSAVVSMWLVGSFVDRTRRYNGPIIASLVLATLVLVGVALWMVFVGKPSVTVLAVAFTFLGITMPAAQPALFELSAEVTFPVSANVSATLMTVGAMFTALVLPPLTDLLQNQPHGIMWSIVLVAVATLLSLVVFVLGAPHYELRRTKVEAKLGKRTSVQHV